MAKSPKLISKEWEMEGKTGFTPYVEFTTPQDRTYQKKLGEKLTAMERDLLNESAEVTQYLKTPKM